MANEQAVEGDSPAFQTWLERAVGHETDSFCIYRNQPLVLFASHWWNGKRTRTFAIFCAISLIPLFIVAIINGTLYEPFSVVEDFRELSLGEAQGGSVSVPLLRDYAIIAIALLMALHAAHMVKQWQRVTVLPEQAREAGLISAEVISPEVYRSILTRNEKRFNALFPEAVSVAVATAVGFGIVRTLPDGVYDGLDTAVSNNARLHYDQAWYTGAAYPVSIMLAVAMLALCVYMMIRHSIMGIGVVLLIKDFYSGAQPQERPWFGYDSSAVVEQVAPVFRQIRLAVYDVIYSVALGVAALSIGTLMIPFTSPVVVALIVMYVLYGPLIIFLPIGLMNRQLADSAEEQRRASERELKACTDALRSATTGWMKAEAKLEVDAARDELRAARELPEAVIDFRHLARAGVVYLIPVVLLIWTLVASVRS